MELRSYNVEKVWRDVVIVRFGNELGVNKDALSAYEDDIRDMVCQLDRKEGKAREFFIRSDGESWTPYMQIIEMLLLLGAKLGCIEIEGKLTPTTNIKILI